MAVWATTFTKLWPISYGINIGTLDCIVYTVTRFFGASSYPLLDRLKIVKYFKTVKCLLCTLDRRYIKLKKINVIDRHGPGGQELASAISPKVLI